MKKKVVLLSALFLFAVAITFAFTSSNEYNSQMDPTLESHCPNRTTEPPENYPGFDPEDCKCLQNSGLTKNDFEERLDENGDIILCDNEIECLPCEPGPIRE